MTQKRVELIGTVVRRIWKYALEQKGNVWVTATARHTRGKELYMVLEKAGETLLGASEAVKKFSER